MEFPGQKRQQKTLQYCLLSSLTGSLASGYVFQSVKTGWYTYLLGLVLTWLITVVEWDYFLAESSSWSEGRYLTLQGYWDLEERARQIAAPKQPRAQITMSGGPAKMTISARPVPEPQFKKN